MPQRLYEGTGNVSKITQMTEWLPIDILLWALSFLAKGNQ